MCPIRSGWHPMCTVRGRKACNESMETASKRMKLSTLLEGFAHVEHDADRTINDLVVDSRDAQAGSCFVALRGSARDGLSYAAQAAAQGAVAVIAEAHGLRHEVGVPVIEVVDLRQRLGAIADRFFGSPSAALDVVAVTGTNGKTTVAHLCVQALASMDASCGYMGTLGVGALDELTAIPNTTPDVITVNRWLDRFRGRGWQAAAIEASSHGIAQGRLNHIALKSAAFTNLGHDHLDYHGSMAAYAAAKEELFRWPRLEAAVVNIDDPLGQKIAAEVHNDVELWSVTQQPVRATPATTNGVTATAIARTDRGICFELHAPAGSGRVESQLHGDFNVTNLLTVAAILFALGYALEPVVAALNSCEPVPGRLQYCGTSASVGRVYVDYAHSPDSLSAALLALRAFDPGRLICVFGCGGNRDGEKRPRMGAIAEALADHVIITTDNPRTEDRAVIAAAIRAGMSEDASAEIVLERRAAIRCGITRSRPGDIVLVAGKGHERFQDIAGQRAPFNDVDEVHAALTGAVA